MPFLTSKYQREILETAQPFQNDAAGFGEVFAASVGSVLDEGLTISGALNREGWAERRRQVNEATRAGDYDRRQYTDKRGRFEYDRFALDHPELEIKTDAQLNEERNALLAKRREYGQDVIERGSGLAQFTGMATGYMLDPVNVATMGVGTTVGAARGMSTAARAMLSARNTAALNAATELMIQPLVYQHHIDIESPYSGRDAIMAIAGAAAGGAVLGGGAGGISGYLSRFRTALETVPRTPDIEKADLEMAKVVEALETMPRQSPLAMQVRAANRLNLWHGSPYKFDRFSLDNVGTGEGAQAYGWGLYFGGARETGEFYRTNLGAKPQDPSDGAGMEAFDALVRANQDKAQAVRDLERRILRLQNSEDYQYNPQRLELNDIAEIREAIRRIQEGELENPGFLYEVSADVDESALLDWDKPFSQQSNSVKDALVPIIEKIRKLGPDVNPQEMTGAGIYKAYQVYRGNNPEFASEGLNEAGIPGIKFMDANARQNLPGANDNFVIFDDSRVTITSRNGEPLTAAQEADLARAANDLLIEDEARYLQQMDEYRQYSNQPTRTEDAYPLPERGEPVPRETTAQEAEALQNAELTDDYYRDMAAFDQLEKPIIADGDNVIDARVRMQELNDELEGLDSVLACVNG